MQAIGLFVEDQLINCVFVFMSREIMLALAWCVRRSGVCSETTLYPLICRTVFLDPQVFSLQS